MTGFSAQFKRRLSARSSPFILGITGGSGSGKTTLARLLADELGQGVARILTQDHYYIDQSHLFDEDGGRVNFDHPTSLDFGLLASHLQELKLGRAVEQPLYDFATHKRRQECEPFAPAPLVIVDGTLILHAEDVRAQLHASIFVLTSEPHRFNRRLKRDVEERGRTPEGVKKQFLQQVKPMHDLFVEPSAAHSTLILSGEDSMEQALDQALQLLAKLGSLTAS